MELQRKNQRRNLVTRYKQELNIAIMKNKPQLLLFFLLVGFYLITSTEPCLSQDKEGYTVDYYYKIKWGYFDEFLQLYKKNHYPILTELKDRGEIINFSAVYPLYHTGESSRWDFRFTIVFKDFEAAHSDEFSKEIIKKLYPDQEKFKTEEQRRFELIVEHMDVPLKLETFLDW